MKTVIIKYNLKDRGRKYRGQDRDWNIPVLVKAINSPETQEKVKNRDMLGFYGHWSRIKFGMNPLEGGIDKGKAFSLEPALVTTYLHAHEDGTVEHQAEFLETETGKIAQRLYKSKVGGFSSAIMAGNRPQFFGFDYVLEPNYATNRGWDKQEKFDSVFDAVFDSASEVNAADLITDYELDQQIKAEQTRGLMALLDSTETLNVAANATIEHLQKETERLEKEKAKLLDDVRQAKADKVAEYYESVRRKSRFDAQRLLDSVREFESIPKNKLPKVYDPEEERENRERTNAFFSNPLLKALMRE